MSGTIPTADHAIAFGPIPSRRLGRSLGINNIPPKHCSYDCVYCQVGATPRTEAVRRAFYPPEEVIAAVAAKVAECRASGEAVEYLSFVPDGEPTLDVNLGREIEGVKTLGIPVAVITNGSLLWMPEVRRDLAAADLVSIEVDSVSTAAWRRVNRAFRGLDVDPIRRGVIEFARHYRGRLVTQTMLIAGVNDDEKAAYELAAFLGELGPAKAYLAVPTRPPADRRVRPADDEAIVRAHAILSQRVPVELLVSHEQGSFGRTGDPIDDLMAILAVHPMRADAVAQYLDDAGAAAYLITDLITQQKLVRVTYNGHDYLTRPVAATV